MSGGSGPLGPFTGRVFLVAGDEPVLADVADALNSAGAAVAIVSTKAGAGDVAARFRADPADPDVWARVVPHVEQRLGPIDSVITDSTVHALASRFVATDLARRGHGGVLAVDAASDAVEVLRMLAGTL